MSSEERQFHPRDSVTEGLKGAMIIGSAGLFASAVRNSLRKTNVGAMGIFRHGGGKVLAFAVAGGTLNFVTNAAANLREKDDHYNAAIGGFSAGAVIGMQTRRMPRVLGYGAAVAVTLAIFDYTGHSLKGYRRENEADEFERKEAMRLNRRRPLEETILEVGEGRGIHPPGYEERRRQRLKEKYGYDINPVSARAD